MKLLCVIVGSCFALLARPVFAGDLAPGAPDTAPTPAALAQPEAAPAPPAAPQGGDSSASSASDDADAATKLPNFQGLAGMQDMIDARIPQGLTIRGGLRFEESRQNLDGPIMSFDQSQYNLQAYAGVAALQLFEVGGRLPFELNHSSTGYKLSDSSKIESGSNVGTFDLAGKISLRLGQLTLAPYLIASFPTGDPRFDTMAGGRVGGAASIALFKSMLVLHANVDGAWLSDGHWALDYRFGASGVPIATKVLLLRPYVYLDGVQQLGNTPGCDLSVRGGVQGLLLDFLTVEVGGSYRFVAQDIPSGQSNDLGTWSFNIGAGVAF